MLQNKFLRLLEQNYQTISLLFSLSHFLQYRLANFTAVLVVVHIRFTTQIGAKLYTDLEILFISKRSSSILKLSM